ncbi:MAG TPA: hypothetical protein VHL80_22080, partial [Polyangia bacterium]|nr:hypothetical protein [Polyangia bacterium]
VVASKAPPAPRPAPVVPAVQPEPERAVVAKPRAPEPRRHAPAPRAPGAEPTRSFLLGPTPQNVDIYMDGKRQFAYDTDHKTLTVPWTEDHVVEFRSPAGCCFVERVEVGPDRPLPPDDIIARRLKWRPAGLRISTDPLARGARIMVRDPRRPGTGTLAHLGEEVDVPFFADDEGSKEVEIAIDLGDLFTSERLTVRAGQHLAHVVKLKASN